MSKDKNSLFLLIKSLSKSEKRQFKIYANRINANKNAQFIKLFDFLENAKKYNEKNIFKKNIATQKQLPNLKVNLYKQILTCLRLNPSLQTIQLQIREKIDFANILYQKGLHVQSLKILEKAKNIAIEYHEKNIIHEIVEIEKGIETQYIREYMDTKIENLILQSNKINADNDILSKLSNLSIILYSRLIKSGYVKSEKELAEITKYFFEYLPQIDYSNADFREKMGYYMVHLWYSFLIQDFLSAYKNATRWVGLFINNPKMIDANHMTFLKASNYLLESLYMIQSPEKLKLAIQDFEKEKERLCINDNSESIYFLYYYNSCFNLCFLEGAFKENMHLVKEVLEGVESYKNQIGEHHIMVFYYKIACLYFGLKNYDKCNFYLMKIVKNKHLKMREDFLCFARILNLVSYYEAAKEFELERELKSTYKFLIKMNHLNKVQKAIILFLRKIETLYPSELKSTFSKLYDELKSYADDPYEKRSFLYLDILSWLKSKVTDMDIIEIIKENAAQSNRKIVRSIKSE